MRLAIQMLAMDNDEIEALIQEELIHNPCLKENINNNYNYEDINYENLAHIINFKDNLLTQVRLENFNYLERIIAAYIIYNLDEDGIFIEYEDILSELCSELSVWPEWVESVRKRLMHLEPIGCGARSHEEALVTQAQSHNFDIKNLRSEEYKFLKNFYTRPAQAFLRPEPIAYCEADIELVIYNNNYYIKPLKNMSQKLRCEKVPWCLKSYNRAHFLLRSLRFREDSLQEVAKNIVSHQEDFFLKNKALKTLSLKDIAHATGLHESSVSRLVKHKYIATKKGIFELKYFFTREHIFIKNIIKNIIKEEDKQKPLSDENISRELKNKGFHTPRRTVAKYRQQLGLAAAYNRRALK